MEINVTSYLAEFSDNAIISFYNEDDYTVMEMNEGGRIMNTTLNDFSVEDLKKIKGYFEKVIKQLEDKKDD